MTTETMTIHEALSELKTLDRRIIRKIDDTPFCVANKHANPKINGRTIQEYKDSVIESYQSIRDLLRRRAAIRNELSKSNAATTIMIGGKEYTVAEAIEMRKNGVNLLEYLNESMGNLFKTATRAVRSENSELDDKADRYVQGLYGSKDKANADDANKAREAYITANTVDLIDPINVADEMSKLADEIDTFQHEVDSKISVSNALTTITISY